MFVAAWLALVVWLPSKLTRRGLYFEENALLAGVAAPRTILQPSPAPLVGGDPAEYFALHVSNFFFSSSSFFANAHHRPNLSLIGRTQL